MASRREKNEAYARGEKRGQGGDFLSDVVESFSRGWGEGELEEIENKGYDEGSRHRPSIFDHAPKGASQPRKERKKRRQHHAYSSRSDSDNSSGLGCLIPVGLLLVFLVVVVFEIARDGSSRSSPSLQRPPQKPTPAPETRKALPPPLNRIVRVPELKHLVNTDVRGLGLRGEFRVIAVNANKLTLRPLFNSASYGGLSLAVQGRKLKPLGSTIVICWVVGDSIPPAGADIEIPVEHPLHLMSVVRNKTQLIAEAIRY